MRGDIVSRRGEGSPSHYIGTSPTLGIGVVALSKGQGRESDEALTHSTAYKYVFTTTTGWLIRGISHIYETVRGLTFRPGTHFQVKDTSTTPPTTLTRYSNLSPQDDPANIQFDFSGAPFLSHPSITGHDVSSGGSLTLNGLKYYVVYVDAEGNESLPSNEEYIGDVTNQKVTIYFKPEPYAKYIRIYRDSTTAGLQYVDIEQYDPEHSPGSQDFSDVFTTTSFVDDGTASWTSATSLPTSHTARQVPDPSLTSNEVHAVAIQNYLDELEVKEYYRIEDVYADHGVDSEVSNIARIMFNQGVTSIVISPVPYKKRDNSGNFVMDITYSDFSDAIDALDGQEIMFFGTTYYSNDILQYGLSKATTLSDKVMGQKERYFIYALQGDSNGVNETEAQTLIETAKSIDNGKRVWMFMVDGGYAYVNYWVGWDSSELTDTRVYSVVNGVDITPMIMAFAAVAKYSAMHDPAESMTNKSVAGFTLPGKLSPTIVSKYTQMGYSVFTADNGTSAPYIDTAVLPSIDLSEEDGFVSIRVVEDIMDMRIRRFLAQYRGRKSLDKVILNITVGLRKSVLDEFVLREWIQEYDPDSIQIFRDPSNPARLRGIFRYRPVYPINQVWVEHEFMV